MFTAVLVSMFKQKKHPKVYQLMNRWTEHGGATGLTATWQ